MDLRHTSSHLSLRVLAGAGTADSRELSVRGGAPLQSFPSPLGWLSTWSVIHQYMNSLCGVWLISQEISYPPSHPISQLATSQLVEWTQHNGAIIWCKHSPRFFKSPCLPTAYSYILPNDGQLTYHAHAILLAKGIDIHPGPARGTGRLRFCVPRPPSPTCCYPDGQLTDASTAA